MAVIAGARLGRGGLRVGGPRRAQRGAPLAAAAAAIAVVLGVFPDALHSSVAGPGPQGAVQPHAQASVTHEGDVPPLNLGLNGAGDSGGGVGTGRPSAVAFGGRPGGAGAGSNPGFGAGAGIGAGLGAGAGGGPGGGTGASQPSPTPGPGGPTPTPSPSPSPGTTPTPPPASCPSCQGASGSPRIPFCYSNSLGPDSQTTEDPLSPPCVSWDQSTGNGGTPAGTQGVYGDHIDVALLGMDTAEDDYINSPATPASDVCNHTSSGGETCYGRNVKVLRQFFLNHFQMYGRTVNFHGWTDPQGWPYQLHGKALADAIKNSLHPFALLMTPSLFCCYTPDDVAAIAKDGIETFTFDDIATDTGIIDQAVVEAGSPYLWTVNPTTDQIIDEASGWVCHTLLTNPVAVSNDPSVRNGSTPRRIALGYEASSNVAARGSANGTAQETAIGRALAERLADAAEARCGQRGSPLFARFNCDALGQNCDRSIELYDVGDATVASASLRAMQVDHDTTVLCVLCAEEFGADFAENETLLQYFPEMLFVAGGNDPYFARNSNQVVVNGMTGLSELWQVPGYTETYWFRAYQQTDPTSTISQLQGFDLYELLMHLFSAVQLAGPILTGPTVAAGGSEPNQVGLCGLRRSFVYSGSSRLLPPTSPSAGHICGGSGSSLLVHSGFLRGMTEERWDPSGAPPGGPYPSYYSQNPGGCYRIIDPQDRYSVGADLDTSPWPRRDDAADPTAPCTGDYGGVAGIG